MFHTLHGTRLTVPAGFMAWLILAVGLALVVAGTVSAMRVRRHMMGTASSWLEALAMRGRETLGYLLHDYDEPDKPWLLLAFAGRVVGGLLVVWAGIGLFVA